MNHTPFIHRCISLASKGRGKVGINPMVGAVLVRNGDIIAEAFHEGFGCPHAERALLDGRSGRSRSSAAAVLPNDILYVNIEPCCHHGKTPPCTDIIIEKGVGHVVYGMKDPNPEVAGKGIDVLRRAGVEVIGPVATEPCQRLNRGFISLQTKGRPWITLKRAQTRSGATRKPDGGVLKITSQEQDAWAHVHLRAKHEAILVGVGTIIADDPQLTVRFGPTDYQPLRIVLDPDLKTPLSAKIVSEAMAGGTLVVIEEKKAKPFGRAPFNSLQGKQGKKEKKDRYATGEQASPPAGVLQKRGVKVVEVLMENSLFDFKDLWKVLITPQNGFHGITSILVEGGPTTWETFWKAGVVDEEVILVGKQE